MPTLFQKQCSLCTRCLEGQILWSELSRSERSVWNHCGPEGHHSRKEPGDKQNFMPGELFMNALFLHTKRILIFQNKAIVKKVHLFKPDVWKNMVFQLSKNCQLYRKHFGKMKIIKQVFWLIGMLDS